MTSRSKVHIFNTSHFIQLRWLFYSIYPYQQLSLILIEINEKRGILLRGY